MRAARRAFLALVLALPGGAAWAQVQPNDPNAANASFGLQSQIRTLNQQRVSDFNTLTMRIQRNVQYQPQVPYHGLYGGRRAGRHGVVRSPRGGFNTRVCIGC
ncbi:hypothetical protein [Methylobacterium sp. NEAU K]|uniref:hypothetical protein n=1 Tax=Methylobacterium sp. NEAU K TaxID=3064946 RepID=UPI002735F1CB|nr:hypothetical protein [Methylobacterium sp. NEAU K]MDP4005565.1 hypothetical protein [Methylobacterium sp. NEAU K]